MFVPRKDFLTREGENDGHTPNYEMLMSLRSFCIKIWSDQEGATVVEYGLIVVMLVIAIISALSGVADENTGLWAIVESKAATAHAGH